MSSGRRLGGVLSVPIRFLLRSKGKFFIGGSNTTVKLERRLEPLVSGPMVIYRVGSIVSCETVSCCREECERSRRSKRLWYGLVGRLKK